MHTLAPARGTRHPIVRLLSSIKLGIVLLTLIVVYSSVMSAVPWVRGVLELSEMAAFRHWLFVSMVVLFCVNLSVATWTRIRWNWTNAGVLTVHAGLLILIGGSTLYFAGKIEGDVLLRAPRIELVNYGGPNPGSLAAIPAQQGARWGENMPFFGGPVLVQVQEVKKSTGPGIEQAVVQVRVGSDPNTFTLTPENPLQPINSQLALRLSTYAPETKFYDDEEAALYVRAIGAGREIEASIHGLPIFRERIAGGDALSNSAGTPVQSKRSSPSLSLGPLVVPTGWFETWRMPIDVPLAELPFDAQVTGYAPYINEIRTRATAAGPEDGVGPGLNFVLTTPDGNVREPLLANDPLRALSSSAPIEFRWVQSIAERDALLERLPGPHELTIEVRDPPIKKVVAVQPEQKIAVEGTEYQLEIDSVLPFWEMSTPGMQGAVTPAINVRVTRGQQPGYVRTVLMRFPDQAQDAGPDGGHASAPDTNLRLSYRAAERGWMTIAAGPEAPPRLGVFLPDGSVSVVDLVPGKTVQFDTGVTFTLLDMHQHARLVREPVVVPIEFREPSAERQRSAIRLKLTGRGPLAGWSQEDWVAFTMYPDLEFAPFVMRRPLRVSTPDGQQYELVYSRASHELGAGLALRQMDVTFFPGRRTPTDWKSIFNVTGEYGDTAPRDTSVHMNHTTNVAGWTLFQSGADGAEHWNYTILGVGNRRGMWTMTLGSVLITIGSMYAFYVKPAIIRRRKAKALAEAEARGVLRREAPRERVPELVGRNGQ